MSSTNTSEAAGTGHVRHADDAYVTEPRVVEALLRGVEEILQPGALETNDYVGERYGRPALEVHPWANYSMVDAGAGEGSILGTCRARGIMKSRGVEFREDLAVRCLERGPCVQASFYEVVDASMEADREGRDEGEERKGEGSLRSQGVLPRPNLVIMNPPYLAAMDFVKAALRWVRTTKVKATGEVKYATVAALLRLPWLASKGRVGFHQSNPSAIWVLPDRPSFTGNNKVDSTDYAWFVWSKDPAIPPGTWRILDMARKPKKVRTRVNLNTQAEDPELAPVADGVL
jgi:hypothetical protein